MNAPSPLDGDTVAHCGHENIPHVFALPAPIRVEGCDDPCCDGAATWYMCCDACLPRVFDGQPVIGGHASWKGDEPIQYKGSGS